MLPQQNCSNPWAQLDPSSAVAVPYYLDNTLCMIWTRFPDLNSGRQSVPQLLLFIPPEREGGGGRGERFDLLANSMTKCQLKEIKTV